MASTYTTNLGIEKIGTGEQSGTWGETTNLNFDIIDQAINGLVAVTLPAAGSTGSPQTLPITDGTLSDGRNAFIELVDGGDLGGTAYVQLTPNDAEKIAYVRNSLSGGRSVILFQGTYNASNDFELENGKDALLFFNGGGSGAVVGVVQANEVRSGSFQIDNIVLDGNTIDVDGDLDVDVSDGDIVLKDDGTTFGGLSIGGTDTDNLVIKSGSTPTAALTLHEGNVGFGTQDEASFLIDAQSASAGIQARFISTDASASSGPDMKFYKNSASPADGDVISSFFFNANTDDGAGGVSLSDVNYGSMVFNAVETNETIGEVGGFALNLKRGGTTQQYISIVGGTTGDTDNDSIVFSTGGTPAITVDNNQNVTFDTNTLFVDAEDNRVGIGNVDPQTALDVTGTVTATALDVDNINIDGNAITSTDTNGNIALTPDGTGEVDISKVDIDGGTIDSTTIGGSTPAAGSFTTITGSGDMNIDSGTLFVDVSENRVGVGTSTPQQLLEIENLTGNAQLNITADELSQSILALGDENNQYVQHIVSDHSDNSLRFHTAAAQGTNERMRIDSGGQISVRGTTTSFDTTGSVNGMQFYYETDSGIGTIGTFSSDGSTLLSFHTNSGGGASSEAMRIDSSGTLIHKAAAVFNEDGGDSDFRVESNNNSSMLFVDAGTDQIGIKTNSFYTDSGAIQINHGGATSSSIGINHSDNATISARYGMTYQANNQGNISGRFHMFRIGGKGYTDGNELALFSESECSFNDESRDQDFRVESDGNSNMLFVDAGNNRVAVGTNDTVDVNLTVADSMRVQEYGSGDAFINLAVGASAASPDQLYTIRIDNDVSDSFEIDDNTDGSEFFRYTPSVGIILNEESKDDNDFRVESTGNANMLFVEAGLNRVGIGTGSPAATLDISGSLSKNSGSFKIDHPLKPETHHLIHSFVEAPQADNIYRGKVDLVNGTATVNIDTVAGMTEGTFVALNREVQCFTSNESGWTAVRGSVSGNILTIEAQDNTCTDTISWLVVGERQDQHMYDTEWTDENGKVIVEPEK